MQNTDATVVTRLLEAGAHIVGKAVCENLCLSATSHSHGSHSHFGHNGWTAIVQVLVRSKHASIMLRSQSHM